MFIYVRILSRVTVKAVYVLVILREVAEEIQTNPKAWSN
jgi:hypothetical protein